MVDPSKSRKDLTQMCLGLIERHPHVRDRTGVESCEEDQRKLREQARKSKAGAVVWEVRESKKRTRPYWFNRRTGESRWQDPLSHEGVGARRILEEGCG